MEFKGVYSGWDRTGAVVDIGTEWNLKNIVGVDIGCGMLSRYRNRVEFKGNRRRPHRYRWRVDIGTEWNLKGKWCRISRISCSVDIGTEWNLK